MQATTDRIERMADRLHDLNRNALSQSKAEALVHVVDVLLGQDVEFCESFARRLEYRLQDQQPQQPQNQQAIQRVQAVLARQSAEFCEDFAESVERRLPPPAPKLRLTTHSA